MAMKKDGRKGRIALRFTIYIIISSVILLLASSAVIYFLISDSLRQTSIDQVKTTLGSNANFVAQELLLIKKLALGYAQDYNLSAIMNYNRDNPEVFPEDFTEITRLAADSRFPDDIKERLVLLNSTLSNLIRSNYFDNIFVTDLTGRPVISYRENYLNFNFSSFDFWEEIAGTANATIDLQPLNLADQGLPIPGVLVVAPVSHRGSQVGVMVTILRFDLLMADIFSEIDPEITPLILGLNREVIYSNNKTEFLQEAGKWPDIVALFKTIEDEAVATVAAEKAAIGESLSPTEAENVIAELEIDDGYHLINNKYHFFDDLIDIPWMFLLVVQDSFIDQFSNYMLLIIVCYGIVAVTVTLVQIIMAINRMIIQRIKNFVEVMDNSKTGNLTLRIKITGNDELTAMALSYNTLIDRIGAFLMTAQKGTNSLADSSQRLTGQASEAGTMINEIDQSVENAEKQITAQDKQVTDTSVSIEKMSGGVNSLDGMIIKQSEALERSSSAIEEMIASIKSINQLSVQAQDQAQTLATSSNQGAENLGEVNKLIRTILDRSAILSEANELIGNIAEQTNLLAMNAAIEAAHAGDSGRGFAVVAVEIRKLAVETSEQAKRIGSNIKDMNNNIQSVVKKSQETNFSFKQIQTGVSLVNTMMAQFKEVAKEQGIGSDEIVSALSNMRSISHEVVDGSKQINLSNKEIITASEMLKEANEEIKKAMVEVVTRTENIQNKLDVIFKIIDENRQSTSNVNEQVKQFVIE